LSLHDVHVFLHVEIYSQEQLDGLHRGAREGKRKETTKVRASRTIVLMPTKTPKRLATALEIVATAGAVCSSRSLCCGSMTAASAGEMENKPPSKLAMSLSHPPKRVSASVATPLGAGESATQRVPGTAQEAS
jgi:hypothetical protein